MLDNFFNAEAIIRIDTDIPSIIVVTFPVFRTLPLIFVSMDIAIIRPVNKPTIAARLLPIFSSSINDRIKIEPNQMFDYALEYELVEKNYSRSFTLSDELIEEITTTKNGHIPFTDEEMKLLWKNVNIVKDIDMILIQSYSGWRPQELCLIKLSEIDFEQWIFVGGMKTAAGKNRTVPIHTKIRDLVKKRYEEALSLNSKYLFNTVLPKSGKIKPFKYARYLTRFNEIKELLNLNPEHRPHDGRKHFVTKAKNYHVDEYAIKYIVGHKITDITEKTYTKRELSWLKEEIEKIKE